MAEKHLSLASDRADVLIYTFDKKIDKPNFLYKSNTSWPEGRNILVEAARKSNKKYKYYILLDDDIAFTKGSFKEFEDEVLNVSPDLCVPVYRSKRSIRYLAKFSPFRYSTFVDWDCCFVCVTRGLFFSNKLFPYALEVNGVPCKQNFYSSWKFWFEVFENYSAHKLLVLNKVHIRNTLGEHNWTDESLCYPDLLTELTNGRKSKMEKAMPYVVQGERTRFHIRQKTHRLISGLKQKNYRGLTKLQNILVLFGLSIKYLYIRNFWSKLVLLYYYTLIALVKDIKLNQRLRPNKLNKR